MSITALWSPSKFRDASVRRDAGPESDLEALLVRMRRRLYPESMTVLGSYWLKTIYAKGHKQAWWARLDKALRHAIREERLSDSERDILIELQQWIQQTMLREGKAPEAPQTQSRGFRSNLTADRLVSYARRLLNQWVPVEVAYLLTDDGAPAMEVDLGMPVDAIAKAIERLLVRDRISPEMLEMLLEPGLLSPKHVYPADAEILRDVVLALLGQTWAPPCPTLPATVLTLAPGTPLPADYPDAVSQAFIVEGERSQEIHVPIPAAQALEMLKCASVRIASTIVTMDGRWWESESLETGTQNAVEYKPGGLLRIDRSSEHAKLALPLPYTRLQWSGPVHLQERVEVFGREWRAAGWETDGDRNWVHLEFLRVLPTEEVAAPDSSSSSRVSHPAFVDMAWSAMADALANSLAAKDREPIEQLRRSELIPLGRALHGFAESVQHGRLRKREAVETHLRSIRYLEAGVSPVYGRAPWTILPPSVQKAIVKSRPDAAVLELLDDVFEAVPQALVPAARKGPQSGKSALSTSPRQAA